MAHHYLDDQQRDTLLRLRASVTWRSEWPTWLLIVAVYGSWFFVATHARLLGLPLATALLALAGAWYLSLQHELLHGHPTRSSTFNALLGFAPLAVWFPFGIYRDSHLAHHNDLHLTHPGLDPESWFVDAGTWQESGPFVRALLVARNTFFGRLALGPACSIVATLAAALRKLADGDVRDLPTWIAHGVAVVALASWLAHRYGLPPLALMLAGYGALSVSAVRSFHEHRVADDAAHRSVINEAGWFWRLLFLNNNYHLVHHDLPSVPWFALRGIYEASRGQYIERSGGFLVKGFSEWMKLYSFTQVAHPVPKYSSAHVRKIPLTFRPPEIWAIPGPGRTILREMRHLSQRETTGSPAEADDIVHHRTR